MMLPCGLGGNETCIGASEGNRRLSPQPPAVLFTLPAAISSPEREAKVLTEVFRYLGLGPQRFGHSVMGTTLLGPDRRQGEMRTVLPILGVNSLPGHQRRSGQVCWALMWEQKKLAQGQGEYAD